MCSQSYNLQQKLTLFQNQFQNILSQNVHSKIINEPIRSSLYFIFPSNLITNQKFIDLSSIKRFLQEQYDNTPKINLMFSGKWKIITRPHRNQINYLRFKCNYCQANIRFKITEQGFEVLYLKNEHNHIRKKCKKNDELMIYEYLQKNPELSKKNMIKILQNKYDISNKRIYYLMKKVKSDNQTYSTLKQFLYINNYINLSIDSFNSLGYPQIILVTSQQMKNRYQSYGDILYFQVFDNIIKNNSLALFSGINACNEIIVFSISLISNYETISITKCLKLFLNEFHVNFKYIIIQNKIQIINSIICLQTDYSIEYLFNYVDAINQIQKELIFIDQQVKDVLIKKFKDLTFEKNLDRFKVIITYIMNQIPQQYTYIVQYFFQIRKLYCLLFIDKGFLGIGLHNNEIKRLLKQKIKKELSINNFFSIFHKILKKSEQILQKSKRRQKQLFSQNFNIETVKSKILYKPIFRIFFTNYIQSQKFQIVTLDLQNYILIDSQTQQHWLIKNYLCQCQYRQKTGIPCCHLIKLINQKKLQFGQFINPRWYIDERDITKKYKIKGPRFTRKNRIK